VDLLTGSAPDLNGAGTAESAWLASPDLFHLPRWNPQPGSSGRVVVIAPHPDDEILGAGGTVARLMARGVEHIAVAVTDGEASHPGRADELRRARPLESQQSARTLGTTPALRYRLGLPDGGVQAARLARHLENVLERGDLVLAPWEADGHPDHAEAALGARLACAAKGANVLAYVVWAWHWASPLQLPWREARRIELGPELGTKKRAAVRCFTTQIEGAEPILTPEVIDRLTRDFEVLLEP
jgi:LmbE family N-acetylglucosaminyl deacetylase